MLIHNSLAAADEARRSRAPAYTASPRKSPARLIADGVWSTIWHSMAGLLAIGRWSVFAERVRRERHTLSTLDEAQLRDIGLSFSEAHIEAARHWTDLPPAR